MKHTSQQVRETLRTIFHAVRESESPLNLGDAREMLEAYAQHLEREEAPKYRIECKRWFERANGNTYHSATIYRDGEQVAREPFEYGYGEQCLQTAWKLLQGIGAIPESDSYRGTIGLRETYGVHYSIADVKRKRDL